VFSNKQWLVSDQILVDYTLVIDHLLYIFTLENSHILYDEEKYI